MIWKPEGRNEQKSFYKCFWPNKRYSPTLWCSSIQGTWFCSSLTNRQWTGTILSHPSRINTPFWNSKLLLNISNRIIGTSLCIRKNKTLLLGCTQSLRGIQEKDPDRVTTSREIRMLERMIPYDYQVHHITARKNVVADTLSRNPNEHYDFQWILGDEFTLKIYFISPVRANWSDSPLNI